MTKVTFQTERCKGCGLCVDACPKKCLAIAEDKLNAKGYDGVQIQHPANKDWGEDTKAMHGITPIKAEADATEEVYKLCREYISVAKYEKKPPQLLAKVNALTTSIANKIPTVNQKQIDRLVVLLLLLSMDECRKSMKSVSWDEIAEKLIEMYVPHADNGNTEMRLRQIGNDMRELSRIYQMPSMCYDTDLFVQPILKVAMDCVRLIHYLERKEKKWKASKPC